MAKLTFDIERVKKMVAHSKGKKHKDTIYGQPLVGEQYKEYLYLVHDQGVYLMSGAEERQPNENPLKISCYAAYAQGCDPDKDSEWYDEARHLVGGDDFAEPLPLKMFEDIIARSGTKKTLVLTLTPKTIKLAAK
jgi:hypothetical protein